MLAIGPVAFVLPWMLAALAALPILWWLLRVMPPTPKRITFPPIRILMSLARREETPARTPWWLLALRLFLAALVIVALAQPLLNPGAQLTRAGPLVLAIDDGWTAAPRWSVRLDAMAGLIEQAERADRPVMLLRTAPPPGGKPFAVPELVAAGEARRLVRGLEPKPWRPDRAALLESLRAVRLDDPADVIWLTDGLDGGSAAAFAERLGAFGTLRVLGDEAAPTVALLPPTLDRHTFQLRVIRAAAVGPATTWVRAVADHGQVVAREALQFAPEAVVAETTLALPIELRNRLHRLEIESLQSAGGVVLLDERWRRRPVGLVSGGSIESAQPLLSELFYLERAMGPFAETRTGTVTELLQRELAVLVLSDIGQVIGADRAALEAWLNAGGVLVRFAGPRMAESADDLVPVRLRRGGRDLGGALSWSKPARLAQFAESSPFFGLQVPPDVLVRRQVLAEPALDLGDKTWARLADGTPLVTAAKRDQGWLVLFHITANTQWSNLAISGLFVEMLRRVVDLAQGVSGAAGDATLAPIGVLDGFGRLVEPGPTALPISGRDIADAVAGPRHPPGYYGRDEVRHALNATAGLESFATLEAAGIEVGAFATEREVDLRPWLLALAIVIGLIDFAISLGLRGLLSPRRAGATLIALLAVGILGQLAPAAAQPSAADQFALEATTATRLAYVLTGVDDVDAMSAAGLWGLTEVLRRRTSVEGGAPIGLDLERDDILFFPLIYWPIVPEQRELSSAALLKLDQYMKTGGTILFDTRDQDGPGAIGLARIGPGTARLRRIMRRLDVPPLIPVPEDHVLTKAFYLMQSFPGRWSGGRIWVERHGGNTNDGVSSIIIGGNDWAAAWALDGDGRPLAAVVPGGERQREMAYRFGVNLVMYALTGNYKADQVHVPAILERLGQ